jgi:hypothetical protein
MQEATWTPSGPADNFKPAVETAVPQYDPADKEAPAMPTAADPTVEEHSPKSVTAVAAENFNVENTGPDVAVGNEVIDVTTPPPPVAIYSGPSVPPPSLPPQSTATPPPPPPAMLPADQPVINRPTAGVTTVRYTNMYTARLKKAHC